MNDLMKNGVPTMHPRIKIDRLLLIPKATFYWLVNSNLFYLFKIKTNMRNSILFNILLILFEK